ncbi:MAG: hypothetical protein K9L30_02425 [Desulfobacterales bacterium]|nr:hypothetical protein [Desulfobacterales bacterium]
MKVLNSVGTELFPVNYKVDIPVADINTNLDEIARYFGGSRYKAGDDLREKMACMLEDAVEMVTPAMVYSIHQVTDIDPDGTFFFKNNFFINTPKTDIDLNTKYIAACICTLGGQLEATCQDISQNGDMYNSMLLDSIGVSLLDNLAEACQSFLNERAEEMELFGNCRIGPGYMTMPLQAQEQLFKLVDATAIDVQLNKSMVMSPVKSLSFFVKFTTELDPERSALKCRRCGLKSCQFRIM